MAKKSKKKSVKTLDEIVREMKISRHKKKKSTITVWGDPSGKVDFSSLCDTAEISEKATPSLRNARIRSMVLKYAEREGVTPKKALFTLFSKGSEKFLRNYCADVLRNIHTVAPTPRMFAFHISELFFGIENGYQAFLRIGEQHQLHSALTFLGGKGNAQLFFPIWSGDITEEVMDNIIYPLWKMSTKQDYSTILDKETTPLLVVNPKFWIVKTENRERLEDCQKRGIRTCIPYTMVKGKARSVTQILEQPEYRNWMKGSYGVTVYSAKMPPQRCAVWYEKDGNNFKKLSRITPTLRILGK